MRKRFFKILVCLTACICVTGVAACNSDGSQGGGNGDEVSEEVWRSAISKVVDGMENYTCTLSEELIIDSTVVDNDIIFEPTWNYDFDTATRISVETEKFDRALGESYYVCSVDMVPGTGGETISYGYEVYSKTVSGTVYDCHKTGDWSVVIGTGMSRMYKNYLSSSYLISEDVVNLYEQRKTVLDLYSSFTYKDGKYTAELFQYYTAGKIKTVKCEVSLEFKNGYLTKYMLDAPAEWDFSSNPLGGRTVANLTFTDFGTTSVNVPAEASSAISNYIAQN